MENLKKISFFDEEKIELGYILYKEEADEVILLKTFVLPAGRGKGIAKQLCEKFFEVFNKTDKKMILKCSYAINFYMKNLAKYKDFNVNFDEESLNECNL